MVRVVVQHIAGYHTLWTRSDLFFASSIGKLLFWR
jgi:hypothetical protein